METVSSLVGSLLGNLFHLLLVIARLLHLPGQVMLPALFLLFLVLVVLLPIWLIRIFRRIPRKRRLPVLGGLVVLIGIGMVSSNIRRAYHPRPLQFDGSSSQLKRTQVVPTLDWPVEPGKNVIWCASFQAAWKKLQADLAKEPVLLSGADAICAALNGSSVPQVPEGELYAVAGWENQGILDEIKREKRRLFPGSAVPEFPGIVPGSFVAYGYIQSACKFTLPYFDSTSPVDFTDSAGKVTPICTFGIRPEDDYAYDTLRNQVEVLYVERDENQKHKQFALDLCRDSEPVQIVFACVALGDSLGEAVTTLEQKIAACNRSDYARRFGSNDVLLVPDIAYRLVHAFDSLQGKAFQNAVLAGQRMDVAQEEIMFRLDRSGAELMSEAKIHMLPIPSHYVADGPCLIYLKKRGASSPYFVMWVDNDELLTKWPAEK